MTFLGIDTGRVAIFGDWHGNWGWAQGAIALAKMRGAQAAIHTGDFGVWQGKGGERFLDDVERACQVADIQLGFVDGNHENFELLNGDMWPVREDGLQELRPHVFHITRGTRWEWDGATWLGLGGAVSLDKPSRVEGVSWWPQEELTWGDIEKACNGGPADVMITHDAPLRVDVPGLPPREVWPEQEMARADQHRASMQAVVDAVKPRFFFHGHFHVRYSEIMDGCLYTGLAEDGDHFPANRVIVDTKEFVKLDDDES